MGCGPPALTKLIKAEPVQHASVKATGRLSPEIPIIKEIQRE